MAEERGLVEKRVQETVEGAWSTVDHVIESFQQVQETVEGVKTALENLLERVRMTLKETGVRVQTTTERIDADHVNQNPWILIGSAILMGYLLGSLARDKANYRVSASGISAPDTHTPTDSPRERQDFRMR